MTLPPGALPPGTVVVLDPRRITSDGGRLVVGGSPVTAIRLGTAVLGRVARGRLAVTDEASGTVAGRLVATNLAHPDLESLPRPGAEELTVVVPVRDRADQLERCLAALAPLRTVVVDDASTDPAAVAAVARSRGAELVVLSDNVGPAGARNAGLARAGTAYVAFVDSDVEVGPEVLLGLARHLAADPGTALVGPRIQGRTRSARPQWFERYDASVSSLTLGHRPSTVRPGAAVAWLPSACLVARRSALIGGSTGGPAGGFTATMRVGEDVDLVWRLVDAGWSVRYEPALVAHHDVRTSVRGWLGRKAVYGSGGAALAARHGSYVAPAVLPVPMALAAAALLTRRRASVPLALAALVQGTVVVRRALPAATPDPDRSVVAARLALRGLGWAVRQESALLVRHWWPAAVAGCAVSAQVRRAAASAWLVDSAVALAEHRSSDALRGPVEQRGEDERRLGPAAVLLGRRLDDLAYGGGLWWGALRDRSAACLRPRRPGAVRARNGTVGQ